MEAVLAKNFHQTPETNEKKFPMLGGKTCEKGKRKKKRNFQNRKNSVSPMK